MTRSLMLSVVVAAAVALQPARLRNAATTRLHAANIQYGDTGGAALVLDDLSVRRGPVELVSGATWTIMPGERWGIVGPNGAGKSTLLGAILGIHDMTTGHVAVKTDADVGYLEQTGVGGSDTSVRTEVMSRMGALAEAQTALTEATARVEGGDYSEEALEALGEAQTQFEEKGGYTAEETVSKVLGGLGFDVKKDLDRPCSDFSGGGRCASRSRDSSSPARTCCSWTSRRTTSTARRGPGSRPTSRPTRARSCS